MIFNRQRKTIFEKYSLPLAFWLFCISSLLFFTLQVESKILDDEYVAATNGNVNGTFSINHQVQPVFASPGNSKRVIIDNDMNSDCASVGGLVEWLALDRLGYVKILGVGISTDPRTMSADAMRTLLDYYGRSDIVIGTNSGGIHGSNSGMAAVMATNWFPSVEPWSGATKNMSSVISLYRRLLAISPDHSVYLSFGGQLKNLHDLWYSGADASSRLSGDKLIQQKCAEIDIGAGDYPHGHEYNFYTDPKDAQIVNQLKNFRVVFHSFSDGLKFLTGGEFQQILPVDSPVRRAYDYVLAGSPVKIKRDPDLGREFWGAAGIWIAFGTNFFTTSGTGYNTVLANGSNYWTADAKALQTYTMLKDSMTGLLMQRIDNLQAIPPVMGFGTAFNSDALRIHSQMVMGMRGGDGAFAYAADGTNKNIQFGPIEANFAGDYPAKFWPTAAKWGKAFRGKPSIQLLGANGSGTFAGTVTASNMIADHFMGGDYGPLIASGKGAGAVAIAMIHGTDTGGQIIITTGSDPAASAVIATVTYAEKFPKASCPVICPANENAADVGFQPYVSSSPKGFVLNAGATALKPLRTYEYNYVVTGQ